MKKILSSLFVVLICATMNFSAKADEPTVIIDSDFSVFTDGTEDTPGEDISGMSTSKFVKNTTGWYYGYKIQAAGGSIYFPSNGYVQSAYLSGVASGGTIRVVITYRSRDSYGCALKLSVGYSSSNIDYVYTEDDKWTTDTTYIGVSSSYTRLRIDPYLTVNGILVKSVKVEYSKGFLVAPTVSYPTNANGTSFTATWKSVSGATAYEIDVYSLAADGSRDYFLKAQETTSTSYNVNGLDATKKYYFVVRAKNDEGKSQDSDEVEVIKIISSLDTPVCSPATNVSNNGFTANWQSVADAESYTATYYEHTTIKENGNVTVFAEDFEGVKIGTFASVEFTANINDYTKQQGWSNEVSSRAFATGNYVIYPLSSVGSITTPAINLSQAEGKFAVTLKVAEASYGTYYSGGKVAVSAYDADSKLLSTDTLNIDEKAYKDYIFNLTGGVSATYLRLTYAGSYKMYIDEVSVSQAFSAGDVVTTVVETVSTTDTSHSFTRALPADTRRSYTVSASARTISGGDVANVYSAASEHQYVDTATGVNAVGGVKANAWRSAKGEITAQGSHVVVYDVAGRVLVNAEIGGVATFNLNTTGVVIVNVDGNTCKIAL